MTKRLGLGVLAAVLLAGAAQAQALAPSLAPLSFLVGDWAGRSTAANPDRGTSSIHPIVGGAALMRNDHHDIVDAAGKVTGHFDQVMPIYVENGVVKADYLDDTHVIHYVRATVDAGKSVQFVTDPAAPGPAFRLTYSLTAPNRLAVLFEGAAPGSQTFHTIASGELDRR